MEQGQDNKASDGVADSNSNGEESPSPPKHLLAEPREGCIVLGKTGSTSASKYNTRYVIDHKLQHKDMTADIAVETFVPCFLEENRASVGAFLWTFISSEGFLLSLHILALALGVSKEALRIRDVSEELELIHSTIETLAACVQISIRAISAYLQYKSIKGHVVAVENIKSSKAVRGSSLRVAVMAFCCLCIVLVLIAVGCMIAFKFLVHLGWTILSNNFVLIVAMVCAGLVKDRMDTVISLIREDQHKTVLFEASLLLKEAHKAFSSKTPGQYFYKVNSFLKCLKDTDLFDQPEHIKVMEKYSSDMNMFMTMDMQGI